MVDMNYKIKQLQLFKKWMINWNSLMILLMHIFVKFGLWKGLPFVVNGYEIEQA
jgi:hypothetical protein